MIVKDGGADLERCLQSAAPFVDRILVGDTGSSDDSKAIARRFGAEVIDIPWEQDFSKARNQVLEKCKCDWALLLDADHMLDPTGGRSIRQLIKATEIYAYHNDVWNYVPASIPRIGPVAARQNTYQIEESRPYPAYVPVSTISLFRNHPGIRFEGCVHESLLNNLTALRLATARAEFVVHHFGFVRDPETRRAKNDLYHALGKRKLQVKPNDAQSLMELGISEFEHRKKPEEALAYFNRVCELSPRSGAAWLYAGVCLSRLSKAPDALKRFEHAASLGIQTGVLHEAVGDAHFQMGNYNEASDAYTKVANRGEASPLSEAKRGASEVHLGLIETGLSRMQRAISSAPDAAELYDILAAGALLAGDLSLAVQTMQARVGLGNLTDFHTEFVATLQAKFNEQRVVAPGTT
jgi:tetratricopeptide (TPR) repeat protein